MKQNSKIKLNKLGKINSMKGFTKNYIIKLYHFALSQLLSRQYIISKIVLKNETSRLRNKIN